MEANCSENMFSVCPICLDDFKDPKTLPCLHSFCSTCLQGVIAEHHKVGSFAPYLSCPQCRTPFEEDIEKLPVFHPVKKSVERKKRKLEFVKYLTQQCDCCKDSFAAFHCQGCTQFFCEDCQEHREGSNPGCVDKLQPLREFVEEQEREVFGNKKVRLCSQHYQSQIHTRCETCKVDCCTHCLPDHHDHDVVDLNNLLAQAKAQLFASQQTMMEEARKLQEQTHKITESKALVVQSAESAKVVIMAKMKKIKEVLELKTTELLSELATTQEALLKNLDMQQGDLEWIVDSSEALSRVTSNVFKDDDDILSTSQELMPLLRVNIDRLNCERVMKRGVTSFEKLLNPSLDDALKILQNLKMPNPGAFFESHTINGIAKDKHTFGVKGNPRKRCFCEKGSQGFLVFTFDSSEIYEYNRFLTLVRRFPLVNQKGHKWLSLGSSGIKLNLLYVETQHQIWLNVNRDIYIFTEEGVLVTKVNTDYETIRSFHYFKDITSLIHTPNGMIFMTCYEGTSLGYCPANTRGFACHPEDDPKIFAMEKPWGLASFRNGDLLVCDGTSHLRYNIVNQNGQLIRNLKLSMNDANAICVDHHDRICILHAKGTKISWFNSDGKFLKSLERPIPPHKFQPREARTTYQIYVDRNERIFVTHPTEGIDVL